MTGTSRTLTVAALPALAISALLVGCGDHSSPPAAENLPPVSVKTAVARMQSYTEYEEVVGTVQSRLRAEIAAKVSGRIEQILATPGQTVKKGELLVQIDDREIQARLDQAEAAYEQASKDLKRLKKLLDQETITQAEYDAVEARERIAAANKVEAQTMLEYTRVLAPFDGVVSRKSAEIGDLASPGRPLLVVEDPNMLRFEADVPEALIGQVKIGDQVEVEVASVSNPIKGTVSEVSPAANPMSRTFQVKLDLPPTPGLRLGQFGRVHVPANQREALRVPASAVLVRGQMELVFVVEDGKVRLRIVKTGKRFGGEIEVVSGLNDGDRVVVENVASLIDGQPANAE